MTLIIKLPPSPSPSLALWPNLSSKPVSECFSLNSRHSISHPPKTLFCTRYSGSGAFTK